MVHSTPLAVGLAMLAASAGQGDEKKAELSKLKGEWTVDSKIESGRDVTKAAKSNKERIKVGVDRWTAVIGGEESDFRIVVDPSKQPKTIDRIWTEELGGKRETGSTPGIYKLEGDSLTVAFGVKRPTEFASPGASGVTLVVYKRAKPPSAKTPEGDSKAKDAYAKELEALRGRWVVVALYGPDGQTIDADPKTAPTIEIDAGKLTSIISNVKLEYSFRLNPSKSPKEIEMVRSHKDHRRNTAETLTFKGIYALEGGELKLCMGDDGKPRPKEFKWGGDVNLAVKLKRAD